MQRLQTGISEDKLSSLSMEVLDYVDRISSIFEKIESCMSELPNYYDDNSCRKLVAKYRDLASYYPIMKKNIKSYSDDFIIVIRKMHENEEYFASLFDKLTSDTDEKVKKVRNGGE